MKNETPWTSPLAENAIDVADAMLRATTTVAPSNEVYDDEFVLPFGALVSLSPPAGSKLPLYDVPPLCAKCSAFAAPGPSEVDGAGKWTCPFCMHLNSTTSSLANGADYVSPALAAGLSSTSSLQPPTIIAVDLCTTQLQLELVKEALLKALESLQDDANVALLAYGQHASSAFRLLPVNDGAGAHADVVVTEQHAGKKYISESKGSNYRHIARVEHCRGQLLKSAGCLKAHDIGGDSLLRLEGAVDAAIAVLGRERSMAAPITGLQPGNQQMERPPGHVAAHIIVVTAANKSEGPGDEHFDAVEALVSQAADNGVVVDAVTYNTNGDFTAALSALAYGTGGILLPHVAAGSSLSASIKLALTRSAGMGCTMEVRCSTGIDVVDAIGPLVPLSAHGKIVAGWGKGSGGPELPPRLRARGSWSFSCNLPETLQGVALLLQCGKAGSVAARKHLYLQVAFIWSNPDGRVVHRLLNRVFKSGTAEEAALATDMDATAVLLSKVVSAEAIENRASGDRMHAEILRRALVQQLRNISMIHGEPDTSSKGWFSGPSRFILPRGSLPLAQVVYFMHQRILRHDEISTSGDREVFLQRLLCADYAVAERMCRPRLHVLLPPARRRDSDALALNSFAGPSLEFQSVPAVDLALLLSLAAVVDCGTVVFVWIGERGEIVNEQRLLEACKQMAQRISCSRSPEADVVMVKQGTPGASVVLQHLIPICSDAADAQLRQLPILPGFSKDDIASASSVAIYEPYGPTLYEWLTSRDMLFPPTALV